MSNVGSWSLCDDACPAIPERNGKPADVYFSAKAVKRKLAELKAVLPPEIYDFPAHTPADEMAVMLPMYQQLADANGRQQVSNGAASTLGLG